MFTNFSPRRHVNDFKGTYFVEKINIYQIKNIFVFTSKDPRIEEFISSAAHFSDTYGVQILKNDGKQQKVFANEWSSLITCQK